MAAEMISVTLQSMAAGSITVPDVQRNLPGSLAVARLKLMMSKLFGLEPSRQVLYFRAAGEVRAHTYVHCYQSVGCQ